MCWVALSSGWSAAITGFYCESQKNASTESGSGSSIKRDVMPQFILQKISLVILSLTLSGSMFFWLISGLACCQVKMDFWWPLVSCCPCFKRCLVSLIHLRLVACYQTCWMLSTVVVARAKTSLWHIVGWKSEKPSVLLHSDVWWCLAKLAKYSKIQWSEDVTHHHASAVVVYQRLSGLELTHWQLEPSAVQAVCSQPCWPVKHPCCFWEL